MPEYCNISQYQKKTFFKTDYRENCKSPEIDAREKIGESK